jgi:hypothetical protein
VYPNPFGNPLNYHHTPQTFWLRDSLTPQNVEPEFLHRVQTVQKDDGRPNRSSRSSFSPVVRLDKPKSDTLQSLRKELRARGLDPGTLDKSAMSGLMEEATALGQLLVKELKQRLRDKGGQLGGTKNDHINNLLQPSESYIPTPRKANKKAKQKAPTKPSKARVAKKRNAPATPRVAAGEKQGKRIKALEADKQSLQEQVASLEREGKALDTLNKIQMESVKHETEARMAKEELIHERATSKLAVENARNVMPLCLASQLISAHAEALGGRSSRGQAPIPSSRGCCEIKEFTVEQAVQFVVELGAPFAQYRKALVDSCVDGELLDSMTDEELQTDIGVSLKLHRRKILNAIKKARP